VRKNRASLFYTNRPTLGVGENVSENENSHWPYIRLILGRLLFPVDAYRAFCSCPAFVVDSRNLAQPHSLDLVFVWLTTWPQRVVFVPRCFLLVNSHILQTIKNTTNFKTAHRIISMVIQINLNITNSENTQYILLHFCKKTQTSKMLL